MPAETAPQTLVERLQATHSVIEEIRALTGSVGISVGVLQDGKVIHRDDFGYASAADKTPPDSDTVYHIGSMTKFLVAAEVAILVSEGKLAWDTPLSELIPEYTPDNKHIRLSQLHGEANIVDLLAHRLGVTGGNGYWNLQRQILLTDKSQTASIVGALEPVSPFRSEMTYNNWAYGLVGEIIEKLTGESPGTFAKRRIFDPLGLQRTTYGTPAPDNYVSSYVALTDRTPFQVPPPPLTDGGAAGTAGCCKSSVNDCLRIYDSFLASMAHQLKTNSTSSPYSPFHQIAEMLDSKIPITDGSTYGLGWALTELPGKGGLVGVNAYGGYLGYDGMPLVARGATKGTRMIYHNGAMTGAMSAAYLLPDSNAAIVVLGNSHDLCDTPDWIAQLLVEAFLDSPERNDFVALAKQTVENSLSLHPATNKRLADERVLGTPVKPLEEYAGRYFNCLDNYFVDVSVNKDGLRLTVQGFENVDYDLYHYNDDVFAWDCDRDADTRKGIFPQSPLGYHKVFFQADEHGTIAKLVWAFGTLLANGDTFTKKPRAQELKSPQQVL